MKSKIGTSGNVSMKVNRLPKVSLLWKVKNLPHFLDGYLKTKFASAAKMPYIEGRISAVKTCADGSKLDYGVISYRVVTTQFVNYLAGAFVATPTRAPTTFTFHSMGTGVTAEAIGDTALVTAVESRVSGTSTNPSANVYQNVATITATAARAVTEHGLFSASAGGELMDRSVFSVVNLASGESLQFTYQITFTAGG